MPNYYSYAGPARGKRDPDNIFRVSVDDNTDCEHRACEDDMVVFIWSGNGYTRRNSWISANSDSVTTLEDKR